MSTHPNTILFCVLTPREGELSGFLFDAICGHMKVSADEDCVTPTAQLRILGRSYKNLKGEDIPRDDFTMYMHDEYDTGMQIEAPENTIVVHEYVTYGYGEVISWGDLEKIKVKLEEWASDICGRFGCTYRINVTANYW